MRADEKRTAALLFSGEPAARSLRASELDRHELKRATRERRFLKPPTRLLERRAMKRGLIDFERNCLRPYMGARYAVLGREAEGAPRRRAREGEAAREYAELTYSARHVAAEFERIYRAVRAQGDVA